MEFGSKNTKFKVQLLIFDLQNFCHLFTVMGVIPRTLELIAIFLYAVFLYQIDEGWQIDWNVRFSAHISLFVSKVNKTILNDKARFKEFH